MQGVKSAKPAQRFDSVQRRPTTHSMFRGISLAVQLIDSFEPPRTNVGIKRHFLQHSSGPTGLCFASRAC
jgi:hypothetical protein